jgi:hypothetical protein
MNPPQIAESMWRGLNGQIVGLSANCSCPRMLKIVVQLVVRVAIDIQSFD